jgi:hypothetical protein
MKKSQDYYVYTHSIFGKPPFYVGKGCARRIKFIDRKSNPHHTNIVAKYGKENIIVKTMLCRSEQHAFDLEVRMIAALRQGGVKLVNLTDGGEGASGIVCSDETRAKRKAMATGRIHTPESIIKMSKIQSSRSKETCKKISDAKIGNKNMLGKKHSEETKNKIRNANIGRKMTREQVEKCIAANTGKKLSPEHIAKIASANKGNKHSLGKKHTSEARAKISKAASGRVHSDETKEKMSIIAKSRPPISKEVREKMKESRAKSNYSASEETRLKISESMKGKNVGKKHTEEVKKRMSMLAKNRPPASKETIEKRKATRIANIQKKLLEGGGLNG